MSPMRLSWFAVPLLNTLFQIFIKRGAEDIDGKGATLSWLSSALHNPWVLAAITVEITCFFLWMKILAELDLSRAFPLSAVSYVLVIASGWLIFGEPVVPLQIIGSMLILAGVWLIAVAKDDRKASEAAPKLI